MTPADYLECVVRELDELDQLTSPPQWQRFVSRRSDLRDRIEKLQRMVTMFRPVLDDASWPSLAAPPAPDSSGRVVGTQG